MEPDKSGQRQTGQEQDWSTRSYVVEQQIHLFFSQGNVENILHSAPLKAHMLAKA